MLLAFAVIATKSETLESFRVHLSHLPSLVRFAVAMAAILVMPSLSRRLKLPSVVGCCLPESFLDRMYLTYSGKTGR